MRMTVKGQVTIPVEVRRKLGLRPGDDVRFDIAEHAVTVAKASVHRAETQSAFRSALRAFAGSADRTLFGSADEALDALRGADRHE